MLLTLVASAAVSWAAIGNSSGSGGVSAEHPSVGPLVATPAEPLYVRHPSLRDLMRPAHAVVRGAVQAVAPAPPLTAKEARAPRGPDLQRHFVEFRTDDVYLGDVGDSFTVLHVLLPGGDATTEHPNYSVGEQYLVFLEPGALPGTWHTVGLDGRLPVNGDGSYKGLLPSGPSEEINRSRRDLRRAVREAREQG